LATASTSRAGCTLHRLDAARGVLPEAAAWLLAQSCDPAGAEETADLSNVIVVVPGRRAGHRLLEILLDLAASRSLDLAPPQTVTLGRLPELLYQPARPLADDAVEILAWVAAIASAREADRERVAPGIGGARSRLVEVARSLAATHRELAAVGLGFHELAKRADSLLPGFGDHARWEALARIERDYLDRIDSEGLWDRQTARREAITRREVACDKRIVLIATVDIDPLQRQMLAATATAIDSLVAAPPDMTAEDFSNCFDGLGCIVPEAWATREIPLPLAAVRLVDDADAQADAVVDWLRTIGGRLAADEITIAVPDAEVAPAIEQKLAAAGATGRYGTGRTVRRSTPWQMLFCVCDWLARGDFASLAALVRSPAVVALVRNKTGIALPAALADEVAARHLPLAIDRDHLAKAAERPEHRAANARFLEMLAAIDGWLAPLRETGAAVDRPAPKKSRLKTKARPGPEGSTLAAAWTEAVRQAVAATLEGVSIDRDAPDDRVVARALESLGELLSSMATIPDSLAAAAGAEGLAQLLLASWSTELVPPVPVADAIDIVGWLEVPLDDAQALAITSAVEGFLPSGQSRDPLLPETLRKVLALEDAARIAARDAWILSLAVCCRSDLLVIVPRRGADGSPTVPSRLLFRRDPAEVVKAARAFFAPQEPEAAAASAPAAASRLVVPRPPAGPVDVASMRVTEFKDYLACPYRYWLRHRLRLGRVTDDALELGPADFGTLIHECLDRFARHEDLASCTDGEVLADELSRILDTFVRFRYGPQAAPAVAVQAELARRRLGAFAHAQARRAAAGWRIHLSEHHVKDAAIDVDGKPMKLSARIDRIDHHPESGRWQLLDYKTSARARTPERSHRDAHGWVDLQLPLYRHLLAALPGIGDHGLVDVGYFNLPARVEEIGIVTAEWTDADYAAADETARAVVRGVRAGVFWPPNDEAARSFPEFDAICQTAAIVDDDEGGEES
jgi:ATP-dependent helicase/nuclease subunit B